MYQINNPDSFFQKIIWWYSIAIVAGIIIAATVWPNYNR